MISVYRRSRRYLWRSDRIGRGTETSPLWARASAPGLATSCTPAAASSVKTTPNSHTRSPNSSLRFASRNGTSVMIRETTMLVSQPTAPESNVAVAERRTPSRREATHATTRIATIVVARKAGQKNQAESVADTSFPGPTVIIAGS